MNTMHLPNMIRLIQTLVATLVLSAASPGMTQDYLGASNVLVQVALRNASPAAKEKTDPAAQLRDDLKTFRESMTNLAPADAAQHWLDLVDRVAKVQRQQMLNYNPNSIQIQPDDVLGALPSPSVWSALAAAIAARPPAKSGEEIREAGLRLLATALTGDTVGRNLEIGNLQAKAKTADQQSAYFYNNIDVTSLFRAT